MQLSSQLLFFFSALGAFNGILLSIYLMTTKPVSIEKRFLAALLLAISIRISKSVWFFFDPNIGKAFLQLGLSACFFIGPLLYFYVVSTQEKLSKQLISWKVHLGILAAITCYVAIFYPYSRESELWGQTLYKLINYTWLLYIVFAFPLILPTLKHWFTKKQISTNSKLMVNVYLGTFLIWLAYFTAHYTSYIVGALSFSFVLYLSILLWIFTKKQKQEMKYNDKKIDAETEQELTEKLVQLMSEEALFKNPNLTLPQLAKKVQVSVPQLSQFLNDNLKKSFAQYINGLRIEEAKRLLVSDSHLTMENVAELAGYNSQSTFYNAFKQIESCTPASYRKTQQQKATEL